MCAEPAAAITALDMIDVDIRLVGMVNAVNSLIFIGWLSYHLNLILI